MYSGSYNTDACQSPNCGRVLTASNSLSQGQKFQNVTKTYHGGKTRRMRGGAVDYPSQFSELLPVDLHAGARVTSLDNAFAQLPSFAGKYGMSGGRRSRRRGMRGGVSPINAPSMLITPQQEHQAFLNPQWYTENQVVPSFKGPDNSYVQKAGKRNSRKGKKASRKAKKASRKNRRR